jgi:hypothetical protein
MLDQGYATFAVVRDLRVGYFLTFKKTNPNEYRVIIFYHPCCVR